MKSLKHAKVLRAVLSSAFLSSSLACLAQAAPTPAQMAQGVVQRYAIMLGLSSAQQEQAVVIFTAEQTAEVPIKAADRLAHETLEVAIKANNATTIAQVSALLGQLNGQEVLAKSTAEAAFYAILTTEQQAKFGQMLAQGEGSASTGGGPGGRGGPPPPPR